MSKDLWQKACSQCGEQKPLSGFYPQKNGKFGRRAACKKCHCADIVDRRKTPEGAARWAEYVRGYCARPESKARHAANAQRRRSTPKWKAYISAYRQRPDVKEKQNEHSRLFRRKPGVKARRSEYMRKWIATPKGKDSYTSSNAARRAQRRNAFVERVYKSVVWKRDGGICYLCGEKCGDDWHLDHKIPLSRGGQHSYLNTGVACVACNLSKHDLTPLEYMRRNAGISGGAA